jgi:hypothetical protein
MSVRLDDGVIRLEGVCAIEDAETLLALRCADPRAPIDVTACEQAHTAVIQLLTVGNPTVKGPPAGAFLCRMIWPRLLQSGKG